ncbi:MAG: hypothetical protein AAB548_01230 [Patescibacteria group bacterium]
MIIIHGEDTVSARNRLNELIGLAQEKGLGLKRLTAKDLDLTIATQVLEAATLFGETPLIIIEGLFSLTKSKNKDNLLEFISRYQDRDLLLFEDKALSPTALAPFAKAKPEEYKPAAIIFAFLDSLRPGGAAKSLKLLESLESARQPAELIFAMLVRQVRLLIQAGQPADLKMAPWQKSRLTAQARLFGEASLLKLHGRLYHLDKDLKTGANPLDLSLQLMSLIVSL